MKLSFIQGETIFYTGWNIFYTGRNYLLYRVKTSFIQGEISFIQGETIFYTGWKHLLYRVKLSFMQGETIFYTGWTIFLQGELSFIQGELSFIQGKTIFYTGWNYLLHRVKLSLCPGCNLCISPSPMWKVVCWKPILELETRRTSLNQYFKGVIMIFKRGCKIKHLKGIDFLSLTRIFYFSLSLQLNVGDLWCFKLWILFLQVIQLLEISKVFTIRLEISKVYTIRLEMSKGSENMSLWQELISILADSW